MTANAVGAFATGNYLGAAVAITGMFAKKADPEAERFQVLMGYLKQQFQIINEKLDEILENQKKLMDAMVNLSKQLENYYEALDERLANIEFETKRIVEDGETALPILHIVEDGETALPILPRGTCS